MARRKRAARPNKRFTPKMQRKLAMLFMGIGLAFITLIVRLIVINQRDGASYSRIVLNQQQYNRFLLSVLVVPHRPCQRT